MLIGLDIYLVYGVKNSALGKRVNQQKGNEWQDMWELGLCALLLIAQEASNTLLVLIVTEHLMYISSYLQPFILFVFC
jgi:hypothetical protein